MNKVFLKTAITSALFFMCGSAVAAKSPLLPANKVNTQIVESRIVGGEEAIQENWPCLPWIVVHLTRIYWPKFAYSFELYL